MGPLNAAKGANDKHTGKEVTDKDLQAARMRFQRNRNTGSGERPTRAKKCQPEIGAKLGSMGSATLRICFDLWLGMSESWAKVVAFERELNWEETSDILKEQWCTEHELFKIFGNKDVVKQVMKSKKVPDAKQNDPELEDLDIPEDRTFKHLVVT